MVEKVYTVRNTCGSRLIERNPFDMVDTMKVKNGIQMDGMHRIAKGELGFVDPSSYSDTGDGQNRQIMKVKWRKWLN